MTEPTWMVVRRSHSILGGLRIVRSGITSKEQAERLAADYKRPHEVIATSDLYVLREAAIQKRYLAGNRGTDRS